MKRGHRMSGWSVALAALAIAGCEANVYEIEMTPTGEIVTRELTCWRERAANDDSAIVAFPEDELARIAAAYDAPVPAEKASKHRFVSVFAGKLPNDLGGSGSYTHWSTPLGSVSAYVERVRGNDDLLADVQRRHEAADRIADLLTGWLASELEGETGFAELREFLDSRVRRDLKNLSLYSWSLEIVSNREEEKVPAQSEWLVRVGQYLVERSYFTPDQLPTLTRAALEIERNDPARLLAFVQRLTASKMGIADDQPVPVCLRFLADMPALEASINEYLRETDEFRRLLEEWKREHATSPEAEEPKPNAILGELFLRAFLPTFRIGRSDQLKVNLAVTTEPFQTNGQWDEQAKQVGWSHDILSGETGFPSLLYAVWSTPDAPAQEAHFGRLVLNGDALGKYCLWCRGLSQQEAKEWDELVSSLRPSDDLPQRLSSFRFSLEPPAREGNEDGSDLAATPRELILLGLSGNAVKIPCK